MTYSTNKEEILDYQKKALASIPNDHPHSQEIRDLLLEQVNDDLQTNANSRSNR